MHPNNEILNRIGGRCWRRPTCPRPQGECPCVSFRSFDPEVLRYVGAGAEARFENLYSLIEPTLTPETGENLDWMVEP